MKFTEYFQHMKQREDRASILVEWIERAFLNPVKEMEQSDGRVRKWAYIKEVDKYLRIIVLPDGETIHNAFFDRSFKEEHEP